MVAVLEGLKGLLVVMEVTEELVLKGLREVMEVMEVMAALVPKEQQEWV